MATLFSGNQIIADIEFDAITAEVHSMEATASQYAVDGGALVSDHVTVLPDGLEIRGGISNADGGERARTVIGELRRKLRARERLEVLTTHELYSDMVFLGANAENAGPFDGALTVRLSFQRVQTATVQTIEVPASLLTPKRGAVPNATDKTASTEKDAGRETAKEAKQSTLHSIFGAGP
ncbi:phage baseplate protein [Pseudomonas sp. GXZC]|uniref:phage baseplate protein n=1 Tax=Pseudomonas sp. GXZC TaxID=3003351 RepID=UPI0022AA58AA|nr:hypothetical protein [Pseudomonas sp. GXZC]WAT31818.1 hypothetical protein OZ428_16180 [Pseudomonas sp. GXZC]